MDLEANLMDRVKRIQCFAFDIDGVMTDGGIHMNAEGEWKRFHVHDGAGIAIARHGGYLVVFLSGRESLAVRRRAEELKVEEVHLGVKDKLTLLKEIVARHNLELQNVSYMGDDVNDVESMLACGFAAAPVDGSMDARSRAHFVTRAGGGQGAVREVIEMILRNQGKWEAAVAAAIGKTEVLQQ